MKTEAIVHSLRDVAIVEIVEHKDNNHCLARYDGKLCTAIRYDGKLCTAIFNPFSGYYYVDDIYGVIEESKKE